MNKKLILTIIIVIILISVGVYQAAFKKEKLAFDLIDVVRGKVVQEISETGQVQKGDKINLSFRTAGRIEKIYVEVGEDVLEGDILAKIKTIDLFIQLQEAKSALGVTEANLEKLLAGVSQEEIKVAQTAVENSQVALNTAAQNLEDAYEDARNVLNDSYLKAYNSQNTVDLIQRTYFTKTNQEGIKVRENQNKIKEAVSQIKSSLDTVKENPTQENTNLALSQTKEELVNISGSLKIIREICETPAYQYMVSSTDKSSLDTQRTNINTALTNLVNAQQSIKSAKLAIDSAAGQLQAVKDELALLIAPPRQEDIDLYQAQVNQAQAQVQLLENQIQETNLRSPVDGQVAEIKKRIGELVQPMLQDVVITILPTDPFTIEVDIYEEDVVKMSVGNEVEIFLVPFPDKIFKGKVVSIDPAAKIIEGVVYYETLIDFEEMPAGLKPGMTADLIIRTASKENVLVVPEDAIQKKEDKTIVEVFQNEKIQEKEIEIGLQGSNDMVEVISGLKEGEKVIIRTSP